MENLPSNLDSQLNLIKTISKPLNEFLTDDLPYIPQNVQKPQNCTKKQSSNYHSQISSSISKICESRINTFFDSLVERNINTESFITIKQLNQLLEKGNQLLSNDFPSHCSPLDPEKILKQWITLLKSDVNHSKVPTQVVVDHSVVDTVLKNL